MVRNFSMADQFAFASLSGDYNKLHVDEIAARRFLFGRPAVHGIHLVLFALDEWTKSRKQPFALVSLKVNFRKPLLVGQDVRLQIKEENNAKIILKLFNNEDLLTDISISISDRQINVQSLVGQLFVEQKSKLLTAADLESSSGILEVSLENGLAQKLFPALISFMPALQIAELLASTRLVGMECPGENSLFSDVNVEFKDAASGSVLVYKVLEFDPRFSKLLINIEGPSIKGVLGAFLRPAPKQQPSFVDVKTMVRPGEFSRQAAFIVGGSRGLGEVAAKLLAAGGAKVLITYVKGADDARRIKDELGRDGCSIESLLFDVTRSGQADLSAISAFAPTHLYYFATGFISAGGKNFSQELFRSFCEYYVSGLSATLDVVGQASGRLNHLFYPSSVFVDERPANFMEYAAAKAAGEEQCSLYQKNRKDVQVYMPRLPRMSTDQTQNLYAHDAAPDPVPVMLEHLRVFEKALNTASG